MRKSWLVALLMIAACSPRVFVETENAPVARGNVNSIGATAGSLYLYDVAERTATRIANTAVTTALTNSGSYSQTASSGIMLNFEGVPIGALPQVEPSVRSQVSSSLEFKMSKYEQRSIPNPEASLNSPTSLDFFESQRDRANNENFRYIFVVDSYLGEEISMQWDGRPADGASVTVATRAPGVPQVELTMRRGAGIDCQGMQNTCVFTAQVFRLLEDAGGLRLVLDTRLTAPDQIQRMLNRAQLET